MKPFVIKPGAAAPARPAGLPDESGLAPHEPAFDALLRQELNALDAAIDIIAIEIRCLDKARTLAGEIKQWTLAANHAREIQRRGILISALKKIRLHVVEPIRIPPAFDEVETQIFPLLASANIAQLPIRGGQPPTDIVGIDPEHSFEKAHGLAIFKACEWLRRLYEKRVELIPEFLAEARFWSEERLQKELGERESQRWRYMRYIEVHCVEMFTVRDYLVADFHHAAAVGNRELVLRLHELLAAKREPVDDVEGGVERIVKQIIAGAKTEALLATRMAELKKVFPAELHAQIDRAHRRAVDALRESAE